MDSFACGRVGIATGMAGQERTQHRYLGNSPALRRLWDIRGLWDGLDQDSGGLRVERADGSVFSVASAVFGWSGRCAGVRRAGGRYGRALKGAGRLSPMRHGAGGAGRVGRTGWAGDSLNLGIETDDGGCYGAAGVSSKRFYCHYNHHGAGRVWRGRNGRNIDISETHQHFGDCGISEGCGTGLIRRTRLRGGGSG